MKKTIYAIALAAVMMAMTSATDQNVVGIDKGAYAPQLSVSNHDHSITLDQYRGQYVVLTFWSSADAASRAQCVNYDSWISQNKHVGVSHVSVNFDSNSQLFAEIASLDGLDTKMQFNVHGQQAKEIMRDFHLADGYGSLLISPEGRVCEINPTISQLASL